MTAFDVETPTLQHDITAPALTSALAAVLKGDYQVDGHRPELDVALEEGEGVSEDERDVQEVVSIGPGRLAVKIGGEIFEISVNRAPLATGHVFRSGLTVDGRDL